jgi:hypothetical protein
MRREEKNESGRRGTAGMQVLGGRGERKQEEKERSRQRQMTVADAKKVIKTS